VAINGFGRIGRNVFKILFERDDIEIVALNDLTDNATLAHLLRYDTNYGQYQHQVKSSDQGITVDQSSVAILSERLPEKLPWKDMNIDVVIESTGFFAKPEDARKHIEAGAKKVVISAPAKGDNADQAHTVVLGVNDDAIKRDGDVFSNASCTTNCVAPVAAVMIGSFGIEKAMMTTIHSYTADQNLQDGPHKDLRRARAAAENIVPTTSGATIAAAKTIPELVGNFDGMAVRVPTAVVSLSDFTIITKKSVTVDDVNSAFRKAAQQPFYQGILAVTDEPLVSSDFKGDSHSAIVDLSLTQVTADNMVKIIAWYDNEWGYSNRLAELVADLGKTLHNE
jgi:glyceraldehyde 3-phosphate dehydrogenase